MKYKIPISVLVLVYTQELDVLLIERAQQTGFWQSVTGSVDSLDETLAETAARELFEETGIRAEDYTLEDWQLSNRYEIYPVWRHRYEPGVTQNREHVFAICVPRQLPIQLAPAEHRDYRWMTYLEAAEQCFSASNAEAILQLPKRIKS
jgi:dATP pyrophosphohydrolase